MHISIVPHISDDATHHPLQPAGVLPEARDLPDFSSDQLDVVVGAVVGVGVHETTHQGRHLTLDGRVAGKGKTDETVI